MSIKEIIVGAVVTVVIGGTAYTVSQTDIAKNFAADTGMSEQQAAEYVNSVNKDELVSFEKLGSDYVADGRVLLDEASNIDCVNYEYEWESSILTCEAGKAQLKETGNDETALGNAFKKLASDSASKTDISLAINLLDELSSDYNFGIVNKMLDSATLDEAKKSNSYNKAVLKTVLDDK